jgi:SAM-dependent methyltransferase
VPVDLEAFVQKHVGPPPARLLELGCGSGALARALDAAGYAVVAVDPVAPEGPIFRRTRFEELDEPGPFDAVLASSSLHHVHDLDAVLGRMRSLLRPGGAVVIDEFAWERLDEATADWYYGQLRALGAALDRDVPASLDAVRARWVADHDGLHTGEALVRALDDRFERRLYEDGPYLYRELGGPATEELERMLVEAGAIQPLGFRYVGSFTPTPLG